MLGVEELVSILSVYKDTENLDLSNVIAEEDQSFLSTFADVVTPAMYVNLHRRMIALLKMEANLKKEDSRKYLRMGQGVLIAQLEKNKVDAGTATNMIFGIFALTHSR